MKGGVDIGRLRRALLAYATLGAFAIGIASAGLAVAPLYDRLKEGAAESVAETARTSAQSIYAVVAGRHQVARQITSRTRARNLLQAYFDGTLDAASLRPQSDAILSDALANSRDVLGIRRMAADGSVAAEVGEIVDRNLWPKGWDAVGDVTARGPVGTPNGVRVILAAPIMGSGGERIGTDIVVADASPVAERLAASKSMAGGTTRVFLLYQADDEARLMLADESFEMLADRPSLPAEAILSARGRNDITRIDAGELIVAVAPVGINGWSVVVKREAAEVFAGLHADLIPVGLAVLAMALVGAFGIYLLLRPVTGALVIHAGTLAQAVKEATLEADAARAKAEQALEALQKTQDSLVQSEKMASLGGLVAGVAHEINTPVGIVLTSASYLSAETGKLKRLYEGEGLSAEEMEDYLHAATEAAGLIQSNALRAADLIHSFKQVAVDQTAGERRTFDLQNYVAETLTSLGPKWKKRNIRVCIDVPEGITLDTDPGAISQILTNLVVNALDHAYDPDQSGIIRISAHRDGEMVEMRVSDDGKGIPESAQQKIFEPFFTTRRDAGGSGLGLSILYNIATHTLGGSVALEPTEPNGSTFVIRFPMVMAGARQECN